MIKFIPDDEVKNRIERVVNSLGWSYIKTDRIFCLKSNGTKSTCVHARCWSLPRIWQEVLNINSKYIIEVIAEKYNELSEESKDKLIIHELLHIPKSFSGALRPHKGYVNASIVNKLYNEMKGREGFSWI